jgi:ankyrin repeat protein
MDIKIKIDEILENKDLFQFKLVVIKFRNFLGDGDNYALRAAVYYGNYEMVEILLKQKKVDPSDLDNHSIELASKNGYLNIAKLLLNDPRVEPSDNSNKAIIEAYYGEHDEIVKLLWSYESVKATLKNNDRQLYVFLKKEDVKLKVEGF